MHPVIRRWLIRNILLLFVAYLIGLMLTAAIDPPVNWRQQFAAPTPVAVPIPTGSLRMDLQGRGPTKFPLLSAVERTADVEAIEAMLAGLSQWKTPRLPTLYSHFNIIRIAELEAELGYYKHRNRVPSQKTIEEQSNRVLAFIQRMMNERADAIVSSDRVTVLKSALANNGRSLCVLARHHKKTVSYETTIDIRWWLERSQGAAEEWEIVDFEWPESRIRFSAILRYLDGKSNPTPNQQLATPTDETIVGLLNRLHTLPETLPDTLETLARLELAAFPAEMPYREAFRLAAIVRMRCRLGQSASVLPLLDRIASISPTNPKLYLAQAAYRVAKQQYSEAQKRLAQYRDQFGEDSELLIEEWYLNRAMNDTLAARTIAERLVERNPAELASWVRLIESTPFGEREQVGRRLASSAFSEVVVRLGTLANSLDWPTLDRVMQGYLKVRPTSPDAEVLLTRARIQTEQWAKVKQDLPGLRKSELWGAELQATLDRDFLSRPENAVRAYELLSESEWPRAVFDRLGQLLLVLSETPTPPTSLGFSVQFDSTKKRSGMSFADSPRHQSALRDLIAKHRSTHADDRFLRYYVAELLIAQGDYVSAERELAALQKAILERPPVPVKREFAEQVWQEYPAEVRKQSQRVRNRRVEVLFWLGKWELAYADIASHFETFDLLAELMESEHRWDDLTTLVKLHEQRAADDRHLIPWKAKSLWHQRNYTALADYSLANAANHTIGELLVYGGRAMLRTGRLDDAKILTANSVLLWNPNNRPNEYPFADHTFADLALVEALHGGADQLIAFLDQHPANATTTTSRLKVIYSDSDLASLLSKPEYAAFRRKYPQPK